MAEQLGCNLLYLSHYRLDNARFRLAACGALDPIFQAPTKWQKQRCIFGQMLGKYYLEPLQVLDHQLERWQLLFYRDVVA
ncbi:hypothetical protein D3C77_728120 [compost metagenome]